MNKISVVIPTLLKNTEVLNKLLEVISRDKSVSKIIYERQKTLKGKILNFLFKKRVNQKNDIVETRYYLFNLRILKFIKTLWEGVEKFIFSFYVYFNNPFSLVPNFLLKKAD